MRAIFIFIWFPMLSWTQEVIDDRAFIQQAIGHLQNETNSAYEDLRFPWIEEYELRTRTNDFDLEKQEFTLRLSPSTARKRRAQQDLYRSYATRPDFDRMKDVCDAIYDVHIDWLELYIFHEEIGILAKLDSIIIDRQTVYDRMMGSGNFELDKLVKMQTEKSKLSVRKKELTEEIRFIRDRHGLGPGLLDFDQFIDIELVKSYLLLDSIAQMDFSDEEIRYEMKLLEQEMALEEAEGRQYFDFLQLRYEGSQFETAEERISLGVGLRLPNSGNRRLKLQELRIEQERLREEERRRLSDQALDIGSIRANLLKDIALYEHYVTTVEEERKELRKLGLALSTEEGYSPLLLLDIEERHVETQLEILDMSENILEDYLEYLYEMGALCMDPLRTHLSNRQ